jgi:hypothetical protein
MVTVRINGKSHQIDVPGGATRVCISVLIASSCGEDRPASPNNDFNV